MPYYYPRFGSGNTFCTTAGVDDGKCAYGNAAPGQFGNASIGSEQAPSYFGFETMRALDPRDAV